MLSIFGVSIVLYFIKTLSGFCNYDALTYPATDCTTLFDMSLIFEKNDPAPLTTPPNIALLTPA